MFVTFLHVINGFFLDVKVLFFSMIILYCTVDPEAAFDWLRVWECLPLEKELLIMFWLVLHSFSYCIFSGFNYFDSPLCLHSILTDFRQKINDRELPASSCFDHLLHT